MMPPLHIVKRRLKIALEAFALTAISSTLTLANEAKTIGSTSLCGDSYVLALAPDLAKELSWQSRSALSRASTEQRGRPQIWDTPEVIAASTSDIILFGSGEGSFAKRLDKETAHLSWGEDFASVIENTQMIAARLNRPDNLSPNLITRLKQLKSRANKRGTAPKVLYLARSGGSAGTGTLVDAVIKAAGGANALTLSGWVSPDPEILLGLKPDLIITSYFKQGYESVNAAALRHKMLSAYIQTFPSVDIDGAIWPCAGPGLIEAAEVLADAMDALP